MGFMVKSRELLSENLGRYANNYQILQGMNIARKYGIIVQIHAENNDFLEGNMESLLAQVNEIIPGFFILLRACRSCDPVIFLKKEAFKWKIWKESKKS